MGKYVLKRFGAALLSLFIIITLIFCLLRLMPIEGYLGPNVDKLSEEVIAAKLAAKGLDKPVPVQLFNFYRNLARGDLGKSWIYRENVDIVKIIKPKILFPYHYNDTPVHRISMLLAGSGIKVYIRDYK